MQRLPKLVLKTDEHYRTINVSGFYGGHNPEFVEAILYTEELDGEEALGELQTDPSKARVKRTLQCRLYLTPRMAKSLKTWLERHINKYEQDFGEIKTGQEPDDKDKAIYT